MVRAVDIVDPDLLAQAARAVRSSTADVRTVAERLRLTIDALMDGATADVRAAQSSVAELEHRVASSRDDARGEASAELRSAREQVADAMARERRLRERTSDCLRVVRARARAVERDGTTIEFRLGGLRRALDELNAAQVSAPSVPSVAAARAAVSAAHLPGEIRHTATLARLESVAARSGGGPAPLSSDELDTIASYAEDAWSAGMQTLGKGLAMTHPPESLPAASDMAGREAWCRSVYASTCEHMGISGVPLTFFDEGPDAGGTLTAGGYTPGTGSAGEHIRVNRQVLAGLEASDIAGTVVHELRHAEQQRVIDGDSFDPLSVFGRDRRSIWEKASRNYGWEGRQGSLARALYLNNPLELDAFASEAVMLDAYEAASPR